MNSDDIREFCRAHDTQPESPSIVESSSDLDDDIPIANWITNPARSASAPPTPPSIAQSTASSFPTTIPSFSPILLDKERTNRLGRVNLHSLRHTTDRTPLNLFRLFVPLSMLSVIAHNTNKYAASKNAVDGRDWQPLTASELQLFIALLLYMGVFKSPSVKDYWNQCPNGPVHSITRLISLTRFEQIKRFLHVSDHSSDASGSWFFDKVNPLFQHFVDKSKKFWIPASRLSTDEMMVMCHGRSSETVRMKNKPIACGFKLWAICDAGYIFAVFPHSNRDPWRHCRRYKGVLPHSSAVVAALVDHLPRQLVNSRSSRPTMYAIYMDNYFSSPKLFRLLREKDIAAVGTVRSNAKGFPKALAIRGKKGVKLPWNTLGAALCEGGMVLALTWIDNGAVQMLTTLHNVGGGNTIARLRKRPRLSSTNGQIVREVFGSQHVKELDIPAVIDDYNLYMGGVDISDQLRASYTCHLPSRRTWLPLFYWLLDCSASNAYKLYDSLQTTGRANHKQFILSLIDGMTSEYVSEMRRMFGVRTRTGSQKKEARTRNVYVTKNAVLECRSMFNDAALSHLPVRVAPSERRECYLCRVLAREKNSANKRQRTTFKCSACNVYLCIESDRNCFIQMHESHTHSPSD